MNCNKKDLYQILRINKNISDQEINSLALVKASKDDTEANKALLVLSDPNKRREYDRIGWQSKWDSDFDEWISTCHSTFEAINNRMSGEVVYHPDGMRAFVGGWELDPSLWAPMNSKSADANWIEKIYSIKGISWRSDMQEFKNKMLSAIDQVWEKKKKTPYYEKSWECVENGNCTKCNQKAKLRDLLGHDKKLYCSTECYYRNNKIEREEYKCVNCGYKGYGCNQLEGEKYYCKSCFNEQLRKMRNSPESNILSEYESAENCDYCSKRIKYRLKDKNSNAWEGGMGSVDNKGNRHKFCSKECLNKFGEKSRKSVFTEILDWMKKEGIVGFYLESGKLVLEFNDNQKKVIEDDCLTDKQKEVKNFFQRTGTNHLNQQKIQEMIESKGKKGDENNWISPVLIFGAIVVILSLIGYIIYKNKKKSWE
ncbi:MAG: hypothetical protein LBR43_01920 [Spiroplasmataceae bacterium]|nr:hypothetical protein [Spiroplasmataceae bacterium]